MGCRSSVVVASRETSQESRLLATSKGPTVGLKPAKPTSALIFPARLLAGESDLIRGWSSWEYGIRDVFLLDANTGHGSIGQYEQALQGKEYFRLCTAPDPIKLGCSSALHPHVPPVSASHPDSAGTQI